MADRVNIPSTLTIEQIKGVEKFQATLAAAASKAFQNINVSAFDASKIVRVTDPFKGLTTSLLRLQAAGGKSGKVFQNIFNSLDESGKDIVGNFGRVEAALRRLEKVAVTGSAAKLRKTFDRYEQIFGDLQIFDGSNFRELVFDRLSKVAAKQAGELEKVAVKNLRTQKKQIATSKEVVAAYNSELEALADLNNRSATGARQNRGLPEFLDRQERQEKNRQQLAENQRKINADNAAKLVGDRLSTERLVRADIAAEENRLAILNRQNLELDKETVRVMQQQRVLQNEINKAESAGVARNNERVRQARQFVNTDPRDIAMLRGAGQDSGADGSRARERSRQSDDVFGDRYFDNIRRGIAEQAKVRRAYLNSAFSAQRFGENTALAAKRYAAFIAGTIVFQKISSIFYEGIQQTKEFDKNLNRLRQVSGGTAQSMETLGRSVFDAAKQTGSGINDITEGLLVFAQAGYDSVSQLTRVSQVLATLPLSPSFDDIKSTAEGLVAVFGQFGLTLADTESIVDRFNFVSKKTAIESRDLIEAASKSGSAFTAAGADLNDFIELTTLLRSSTRESASVISTFFRTTLTKLQGRQQQNVLETLIGPESRSLTVIEQLRRLAPIFAQLDRRQKSGVLFSITDVRQASRFEKLLNEINDQAFKKSTGQTTVFDLIGKSSGSLRADAKLAEDNLDTSFKRITAAFADMIETLSRDKSIKSLIKDLAGVATGFSDVVKSGKLLIGLIAALGTAWAAPKIRDFASGFFGSFQNRGIINRVAMNNGISTAAARSAIEASEGNLSSVGLRSSVSPAVRERYNRRFGSRGRFSILSRLNAGAGSGAVSTGVGFAGALAAGGLFNVGAEGIGLTSGQNMFNRSLQIGGAGAAVGSALGVPGAVVGGILGAASGLILALKENTAALRGEEAGTAQLQASKGNLAPFLSILQDSFNKQTFSAGSVTKGLLGISDSTTDLNILSSNKDLAKGVSEIALATLLTPFVIGTNAVRGAYDNTLLQDRTSLSDAFNTSTKAGSINTDTLKTLFNQFLETNKSINPDIAAQQFVQSLPIGGQNQDGIRKELVSIIQNLQNKTGGIPAAKEIRETLNASKKLTDSMESAGQEFDDFNYTLNLASVGIVSFAKLITESTTEFIRKLDTIITDFDSLALTNPSSDNQKLLADSGLDTGLVDQLRRDLGNGLVSLSRNFDVRNAIKGVLDNNIANTEDTKTFTNIQGFVTMFTSFLSDSQQSLLETTLNQFASVIGSSDVNDTLTKFQQALEQPIETVNSLFSTFSDSLAESERARLAAIDKELNVRKALADSMLDMRNVINDIVKSIGSATFALEDRVRGQAQFVNNRSGVASGIQNASVLLSRAGTSAFGSTAAFVQNLVQANLQRLGNRGAAANSQRSGGTGGLFSSLSSQTSFNILQQELSQRLDEFDLRVTNAADAADILRSAFETLEGSLISAGEFIRGLSIRDFGNMLSDTRRFTSAVNGDFSDQGLNRGFQALGPGGLDNVLKVLQLIGDRDIGNGFSGTGLGNRINSTFGAPGIAAAINAAGGNVTAADLQRELEDIFEAQQNASRIEQEIRQEQMDLLRGQYKVQTDTLTSLNSQTAILSNLVSSLAPLEAINEKISKMFGSEAQLVDIGGFTNNSLNNTPLTPSQPAPQRRPNPLLIPRHPRRKTASADDTTEAHLSVDPIQVAVTLNATDVMKVYGPQLIEETTNAIYTKLAAAFPDDPRAQSILGSSNLTRTV